MPIPCGPGGARIAKHLPDQPRTAGYLPKTFAITSTGCQGPRLTLTDVVQRLRAFNEEPYEPYPDEDQKDACLEIYNRERSEGTDMPAIVGAIQQFVEEDREARERARQEAYRAQVEADRLAAEERLLSGADCKWTALGKSKTLHCRTNGRLFRLEPQPDKRFHLFRVKSLEDQTGELVGRYAGRTEATRVVGQMAYNPEPRWR